MLYPVKPFYLSFDQLGIREDTDGLSTHPFHLPQTKKEGPVFRFIIGLVAQITAYFKHSFSFFIGDQNPCPCPSWVSPGGSVNINVHVPHPHHFFFPFPS